MCIAMAPSEGCASPGLAFSMLCSVVQMTRELNGLELAERAIFHINTLSDELSMDYAKIALLVSIYFLETNRRSAAWIWLGSAVRCAQEFGLHVEVGNLTPLEAEVRKRTWWAIYNWDRFCALEIGQIGDGADPDVEISEPTPNDADYIGPDGIKSLEYGSPSTLLILVPVGRLVHQLRTTLKARSITSATLTSYDDHFRSIMESYPDPFPIGSITPLDPSFLYAATALHVCKFVLFRHNLSPVSRAQERHDAVARCVHVAKDTAHYIWRTTPAAHEQNPGPPVHPPNMTNPEWQSRIRHAIPSLIIKHWWRCVLILAYAGEFGPALTIVGAMTAIDDARKANLACGRNLAFFLDLTIQKWTNGRAADTETDEELLAYASGDMQGSSYSAWAWTGADSSASSPAAPTAPPAQPALLSADEEREWGGWPTLVDMLRHLQYLQSRPPAASTASPDDMRRSQPYPRSPPRADYNNGANTSVPPTPAATVSRISIKDIM